LGATIAVGGYAAARWQRWFWVAICSGLFVLLILGNLQSDSRADMIIVFWGEGGAFVLSTVLMLTFYSRPDSPLTRNQIRWALLLMGAMAFWSVYSTWAGGFENIANILEDTDERGPSDQRRLMLDYGWSIYMIIHRYWAVAHVCMAALATAYAAGLVQAKRFKDAIVAEV
jgi:hypothetical protein